MKYGLLKKTGTAEVCECNSTFCYKATCLNLWKPEPQIGFGPLILLGLDITSLFFRLSDLGWYLTTTFSRFPDLEMDLTTLVSGLLDSGLNLVTSSSERPVCGIN